MAAREAGPRGRPHFRYLAVCGAIGVVAIFAATFVDFGINTNPNGDLPQIPGMPSLPSFPTGLPTNLPSLPALPSELTNLPGLPTELSNFPTDLPTNLTNFPTLPTDMPGLPTQLEPPG